MVTAVDEDVVTAIAVVGPAILKTDVFAIIRLRLQAMDYLRKS
jgi:hypothetical protein